MADRGPAFGQLAIPLAGAPVTGIRASGAPAPRLGGQVRDEVLDIVHAENAIRAGQGGRLRRD
ncbi:MULTISPECIES: hypothetical protein [unclassified Pseudofrankia]|uniref:hypothetical protein n=1 Tax=unclassified Pseudofrankia TaxID=2994372 RepID=UPI00104254AF|nr:MULTISPECIES: hypothetical protein [unclassified Pseudofrankia]MDT3440013.1 hypothetical protein [Pseudofrankia sp. BMG5.37]